MNRLFYIAAYSHRLNEWQRMMVTAKSEDGAKEKAAEWLPHDWSIDRLVDICATPDIVNMDL